MCYLHGSEKTPALGLLAQITLILKHDFRKSCKCSAIVNTCSLMLNIPDHIRVEEKMFEVFGRRMSILDVMYVFNLSFIFSYLDLIINIAIDICAVFNYYKICS